MKISYIYKVYPIHQLVLVYPTITETPQISESPTPTPTETPTNTPSETPAAVTATTYVYNIGACSFSCDSSVCYSSDSSFVPLTVIYSDINLTTFYPDGLVYYEDNGYNVNSGQITLQTSCLASTCDTYTNYDVSNNSYGEVDVTITLSDNSPFTFTVNLDTTYWDVRLAIKGDTMATGNIISATDAQLINQWVLGNGTMTGFDFSRCYVGN